MNQTARRVLIGAVMAAVLAAVQAGPAPGQDGGKFRRLSERFVSPPPGSGTVTLYWLNGTITQEGVREQMRAMRDQCGFGGVAPLTFHSMQPPTQPPYLSDDYFDVYGCILDTARELGMSVVFYDDCDFPSGSAGNQMRERYAESLLKYLARGTAIVTGPGAAVIPMRDGVLMSVVAKNLDDGRRQAVTGQAAWIDVAQSWQGRRVGFRQSTDEIARVEYLRVLDSGGGVVFEERFDSDETAHRVLPAVWKNQGASSLERAGLRTSGCLPMWHAELALPDRFTLEARITIVHEAAGLAFGIGEGEDDYYFWQLHAGLQSIRPHRRQGQGHELLQPTPFPFVLGQAYDIRLDVDGRAVTTWIDGQQVAAHTLDLPQRKAVRWMAPAGRWDVQAFVCATVPGTRLVDYLDPQAVRQFLTLTYDQFDQRFREHFGTTIQMTFFDDLSAMQAPDCLIWTPAFRERFEQRCGRPADLYYPALWEDIGPDTAAARVALFSVRNEMFAAGYPGVSEQWCAPRGIKSSGHPASSYNPTPLQSPGDAMLFYKYQGYPLTDYIHYYHHGIDGFKVPASAAHNFDRAVLVCEIYGNFQQRLPNDARMLYRAGMECYTRGVNFLLPHGTWWDPEKMSIVPEISWRNPALGAELPAFNRWAARCETLLRGGRHVADIGMLYPIADLSARYCVSQERPNWGYKPLAGTDYFEIMRLLTGEVRRDFTLLHPEVLDQRCRVEGDTLLLDNRENWERFRVMLLPACRTIHLSNLRTIKQFYDAGGTVLATTCLPEQSAEFGQDDEVRRLVREMFGTRGRGVFVAKPDERTMRQALDDLDLVWDVRIDDVPEIPRMARDDTDPYINRSGENPEWYEGGNRQFTYIHKVKAGAECFLFANSSAQAIQAAVSLRGHMRLQAWDPHTGVQTPVEVSHAGADDGAVTRLTVSLDALQTRFFVSPPAE